MRYILSVALGVCIGLAMVNHDQNKQTAPASIEEADRVVFSSDVVRLEALKAAVRVEFTGDLGEGILGTYSAKKNLISIKCPEAETSIALYGTIAHEATHFAIQTAAKKGIKDEETIAYMVGYTTEKIIEKINCNQQ